MTVVFKKRLRSERARPRLGESRLFQPSDDPEFESFANIAEMIDRRVEVAVERAIERDKKVYRSRPRASLERRMFLTRLATHIFHVQYNHRSEDYYNYNYRSEDYWPIEKIREWLGRLGLERDFIDDLEYEVALRHCRQIRKENIEAEEHGAPITIMQRPEHPAKRRKRLRKD